MLGPRRKQIRMFQIISMSLWQINLEFGVMFSLWALRLDFWLELGLGFRLVSGSKFKSVLGLCLEFEFKLGLGLGLRFEG